MQPRGRDHRHLSVLRNRQSSPASQDPGPVVGIGQPSAWVTPRIGFLCTRKATAALSADSARAPLPRLWARGDLPRMPAVRPASLPRWFSYNTEKEATQTPLSHRRPPHIALPLRAFSIAHFESCGALLPSKEIVGCEGLLSFSLFILPLPAPLLSQSGKGGANWERGARAAEKGYFRRKTLKERCWPRDPT